MNNAQFVIGLLKNFKDPDKQELTSLLLFLYGDLQVLERKLQLLVEMRDKSKLLVEEEYLSEEQLQYISHGKLFFTEWKSDCLPWDDRGLSEKKLREEANASSDNNFI